MLQIGSQKGNGHSEAFGRGIKSLRDVKGELTLWSWFRDKPTGPNFQESLRPRVSLVVVTSIPKTHGNR